ncbi:MAG: hypothetical protein IJ801_05205 [Lachnospiraceae bacterium]|nr:hypothetical protein [Lachnospiraceae bacterium]
MASKFLNIQLEYLGYVPMDKKIVSAVIEQKPISLSDPGSEPALQFQAICNRLLHKSDKREKQQSGIAKVLLSFIKSKKNNG